MTYVHLADQGVCSCGCPKVWHSPKTPQRRCELCTCETYRPWVGAGPVVA